MKRIALSLIASAGLAGVVVVAAAGTLAGRSGEVGAAQAAPNAAAANATPAAAGAGAAAEARSGRQVDVASPYAHVENEPPPRLIVDEPLPDLLNKGVVWIQYRAENVHIVPVFGKEAVAVNPRVGHLHVHVDDVPWWWADPSNTNTVDIAGMPPGEHKVRLVLVDGNHEPFPGQSRTVKFTVPGKAGVAAAGSRSR